MKKLVMRIAPVATLLVAGCVGDWWDSNRCVLLDRNHTFTRATVTYGNTNVVYDVIAWMDYAEGDEVQLWVRDASCPRGHKVILTHYANVVLENPNPKYDLKF
jgi:hypothetical protein